MFPVFFCLSLEKVDSQNQKLCADTIVLYDLGYRTIRFGISYYTIRDIVLYDLEYRSRRFRESLSGAAKTRVMGGAKPLATCKPPLTLPPAMQMDVCGGNKCHTCRWGFRLAVMWLSIIHNHLIHSKIRCF